MTRYIAFLRKINVGGKNLLKMDELTRIFTAAGFKNARTYIQCGNVIFDSASANVVGSGAVGFALHPTKNAAAITARVTVRRMATPPTYESILRARCRIGK